MAQRGLWPTPTTQDAENTGGPAQFRRNSLPLNAAVQLWPMPTVNGNYNRVGLSPKAGDGLATAVRRAEEASAPGEQTPTRGPLNPRWVEWLMGFPDGWTACVPSATRSSRKSRRTSAAVSEPPTGAGEP